VSAARSAGAAGSVSHALEYLVNAEIWRGAYASAEAHAQDGLRLALETGQGNSACHLMAYLALVAAFRGEEETCRARAREALNRAAAHGLGLSAALASWALAILDLATGHPSDAEARLTRIARAGPGTGHPVIALLSIPHHVEAIAGSPAGDADAARAAAMLDVFDRWATDTGYAWSGALVARCRALLATTAHEADRHFREALRLHGRSARPFDRARTELLYGEALRRARRRADARVHLRSAVETFEQLGAGVWATRARDELRATGERVAASPPSDGQVRLTPQELQIARSVAEGATNREVAARLFLSPRTVDYHLRKVFTKLGITSRIELARLNLTGPPPD
jgi:DNA-binding NarL/FixJ family response regulator